MLLMLPAGIQAQQRRAAAPVLRVLLPVGSDQAYIYHTLTPPPGHGVMLYRTVEGEDEEAVMNEPLLVSFDPAEIQHRAGDSYAVMLRATGRTDALSAFIALRQDPFNSALFTFLSPEIANLMARRLIDTAPPANRLVTYKVVVVNDLGEPLNEQLQTTVTLNPSLPPAPYGLELENLGDRIRLKWNYTRADPNDDDAVVAFQAGCSVTGDMILTELHAEPSLRTLNTTSFQTSVEAPQPGSQVTCRVIPVTFAGTYGLASPEASLLVTDISPLPVTTTPEAEQTAGHDVLIRWTLLNDARVGGYNIYRAELSTDGFIRLNDAPLDPLQGNFTDRVPRDQMPWYYRVSVVGADGREGALSAPGHLFVYDITPPTGPVNFRATASDNQTVLLQWEDPRPAEDLWTYVLLRVRDNPAAGPAWTQLNQDNNLRATRYTDTGVSRNGFVDGEFYRYAIVAIDSARNRSDTLYTRLQIPDLNPPAAPGSVTAAQADGYRVNLNWNASPDGDVITYILDRADGDDPSAPFSEIVRINRNQQFYRDAEVVPGNSYRYRVTAVDSAGNNSRTPSPVAEIMVRPADPPANVRNTRVEVFPDGTGAEVIWEPVRSPHLAGYRIYRSDMATGVYSQAGETGPDQTSWSDTELDGRRWWYKVYAVDVAGVQSRLADAAR